MGTLSSKLTSIIFGVSGTPPSISRCTINLSTGAVSGIGNDAGQALQVTGTLNATNGVWNALWNDIADFQLLNDQLIFGKCYFDTKDGAKICSERCQMSAIGIASDTFGVSVGSTANPLEVPIAIAGWVLAHVDQEYECGTVLTNDENGNLTAMTREEKLEYPERILALYKRKEMDEHWGDESRKVKVSGRHWVKVK
jgi:hypothetical protein